MNNAEATFSKEDMLTINLAGLYEKWGYKKYSMAKFEEYSFYSDNRDFLTDEGIIAFNNSDGRLMALKPDITLSIVKNAKLGDSLTKLYYNESVFRMNESKKDFREIKQTGVELLGDIDNYLTAEIIMLAAMSLNEIDSNYVISVSHMAFISGILSNLRISQASKKRIVGCVKAKNLHDLADICRQCGIGEDVIGLISKLLSVRGSVDEALAQIRNICINDQMKKACDELEFVCSSLKSCGADKNIIIDLSVMNNIDYYNGIIFHGYVRRAPARVLSGGRYDNLAGKIRESIGAIGFAVYLDGLNLYYKRAREFDTDILVIATPDEIDTSLLAAVSKLAEGGSSIRVEHTVPGQYKARKTYRFAGGRLEEINNA